MLKFIRYAGAAAAIIVAAAPVASARTYTYYDRDGRAHYTHSRVYAQNHDQRRTYPVRDCGRSGTKGAVIGGIGGAVVGQAIGHNTGGTLIGAGVGALAGHQIGKSRCESR